MFVNFHPIVCVFLIAFHTVQCVQECPSFEYVERMLKTESDMSTLTVQTGETIKELQGKTAIKIRKLQSQMAQERNELKQQMKNELEEMKNAIKKALSNLYEQMTADKTEMRDNLKAIQNEREEMANATDKALSNLHVQMIEDKTELRDNLKAIQNEREEMANATDKALSNFETFTSNLNDKMYQVATDVTAIEEINFQAHSPSTLNPTSSVPFIFTMVDVNNGGGYDDTTGIFSAPVAGLYAFSLQVCTNKNHIFPAIVKENAVLLPTRHHSSNAACTSSSVYTQLSDGDRVWIKCTHCSSRYGMYENPTHYWNAFSGALVHK